MPFLARLLLLSSPMCHPEKIRPHVSSHPRIFLSFSRHEQGHNDTCREEYSVIDDVSGTLIENTSHV